MSLPSLEKWLLLHQEACTLVDQLASKHSTNALDLAYAERTLGRLDTVLSENRKEASSLLSSCQLIVADLTAPPQTSTASADPSMLARKLCSRAGYIAPSAADRALAVLSVSAMLERELQGREAALLGAKTVVLESVTAALELHEDDEEDFASGAPAQEGWVQRAMAKVEAERVGAGGAGWLDVCGVWVRNASSGAAQTHMSTGRESGVWAYSGALGQRWGWDETVWERCVAVLASR